MALPPTSTKGSGDSNPVTTFEIDFPNNPITHTGVKASIGATTIAGGGTGQVTKAAAFDALSPLTTGGDLLYGGASGTGTRLANGSSGQVLISSGGTAAPTWGNTTSIVTSTSTSLTAGAAITISTTSYQQMILVAGTSSVTLSTTPFGTTPPPDGAIIQLIGSSNTATVTIANNDAGNGCIVNGNPIIYKYNAITFQYSATFARYVEIARNF